MFELVDHDAAWPKKEGTREEEEVDEEVQGQASAKKASPKKLRQAPVHRLDRRSLLLGENRCLLRHGR